MMKNAKINLFYPYIPVAARDAAMAVLNTRWIGQGPKVDEFEKKLSFLGHNVLTLNSGTSAIELAYHLLNLKKGDEVITPVFSFVGTNLPLIRRGVKVVFADISDNLSLDFNDAISRITPKTKAIINMHLFGKLNRAPKLKIPIIGDAANYLDKTENEQFTIYSFQATKIITTVDGGALVCKNREDYNRGKLLRWYGIDRESGADSVEADITEAGYKYHMNDVAAAMGIAQLKNLDKLKKKLEELQECYFKNLSKVAALGGFPFLIHTENREKLRKKLDSFGVETGLIYKRNDLYSIFGGKRQNLPDMNRLEKTYLFLPCHNKMSAKDVFRI